MHSSQDQIYHLGVAISRLGLNEALTSVEKRIKEKRGGYVCFVNSHLLTQSTESTAVRTALNEAFLSVADGMPLVATSRLKRRPIRSRVPGPTFTDQFIKRHSEWQFGFIGGKGPFSRWIEQRRLNAVVYNPPFRDFSPQNAREDWREFLTRCPNRQPPNTVWVGLGAPKQELWMHEVSKQAPETLFMGVGAAFDFLSGEKARAPLWMQNSGLEWLHRLAHDPRRLAKRYFINNLKYIGLTLKELIHENFARS